MKKPQQSILEKAFFIRNPDGFIFTHLFASGSVHDSLRDITGHPGEIMPVSLRIAKPDLVKSFKNIHEIVFIFPDECPGTTALIFPRKEIARIAGKQSKDFLDRLFVSLPDSLGRLLEKNPGDIGTGSLRDMVSGNSGFIPWIKYHIVIPGITEFFFHQAVSPKLFSSVRRIFVKGADVLQEYKDPKLLLEHFRELNNGFQENLFSFIEASEGTKVELGGDLEEVQSLNLEELRLAPERTIRAVIEETVRKRWSAKTFVFALQGMSDELRGRFMQNLSKNRKQEIRDGMRRWEADPEDISTALRDLAWLIVDLLERSEVKIDRRIKSKLDRIIQAMDESIAKSSREYVESGKFSAAIQSVNDVMLQLLVRRVGRKILVQALSFAGKDALNKVKRNSTAFAFELLDEDMEHWNSKIETDNERVTFAASAQRAIIRQAHKLREDLARQPF